VATGADMAIDAVIGIGRVLEEAVPGPVGILATGALAMLTRARAASGLINGLAGRAGSGGATRATGAVTAA